MRRKLINENFFKTWSEEMAYILGYWFADGCITRRNDMKNGFSYLCQFGSKDKEQLEKINTLLDSNYKISEYIKTMDNKNFTNYSLHLRSKKIYDDIIKLGGRERKSLIARFPNIPRNYIRHFIRGYFDGDGSISIRNNNYSNITFLGTNKFLQKLNTYLPISSKVNKFKSIYRLDFCGENAVIILKFMYLNSTIYLDRKYTLFKKSILYTKKYYYNKWKEDDIELLKEKYPLYGTNIPDLNSKFTNSSIWHKAHRIGIKFR